MNTQCHTSPVTCLLPGSIFIQLYPDSGLKNLFNKIYTVALLKYPWLMVLGSHRAANEVNNLVFTLPASIAETKRSPVKKSLCH
jgi:hypothetical protein